MPTGCIITFSDDTKDSEYCNTIEEFIDFLSSYQKEIKKDNPDIIAHIDATDVGYSNVDKVIKTITDYIKNM
jgi:hypothetical protein